MKQYYQDYYTDQSFELLKELNRELNMVLIGGWAVWLYTRMVKSKDVDLIIDYPELAKLYGNYQVAKNDRLKKYEVIKDDIHVDIYLPHYSMIGVPVEKLVKHQVKFEGYTVLRKEALVFTKQVAHRARFASHKGRKDKIDILSLVFLPDFDLDLYQELLVDFGFSEFKTDLGKIFKNTFEMPELNLNKHAFSREKKRIENMLKLSS